MTRAEAFYLGLVAGAAFVVAVLIFLGVFS